MTAVPRRVARPLFSPFAWCLYALALVADLSCLIARPELRPVPADLFFLPDAGLSILVIRPFAYLLIGVHEAWHWLAARAEGLGARFGVDRRLYFLVFETDLSQIWSLPRRRRYGPQLAGLAVDAVTLALLLGLQLGTTGTPRRFAAALAFGIAAAMVWQCMIFLRTDLYGVLVTATGCRELWRTKTLLLRRAFGRLTPSQRDLLDRAHPADVRVGRWFRWVYLGGLGAAAGYLALVVGPVLWTLAGWTARGLAPGVRHGSFWVTALVAGCVLLPHLSVAVIWLREVTRRGPPGRVVGRVREEHQEEGPSSVRG